MCVLVQNYERDLKGERRTNEFGNGKEMAMVPVQRMPCGRKSYKKIDGDHLKSV